jgi:hypothetical protein
MSEHDTSKRQFIKTAAYVAPLILTLNAAPSLAAVGSVADGGRLGNGGSPVLGNGLASGFAKRPKRHSHAFLRRRRMKKHRV